MIIIKYLIYMINNRIIRYLFFGALTVIVNLFSYFVFRTQFGFTVNTANIISIIIAILFAYIVNSKFVFKSKCIVLKEKLKEFIKFINARISTMIVEVVGIIILTDLLKLNDFVSKIFIQIIVIVLNYLLSKTIVFRDDGKNI